MMKVVEKRNFSAPVKMSLSSPSLDQVDLFFIICCDDYRNLFNDHFLFQIWN